MRRLLPPVGWGVAVLAAWSVAAVGAIMSGFPGMRGGLLWSMLAFVAGPCLVVLAARRSWRWPAVVVGVGLLLAVLAVRITPMDGHRLLQELDVVAVPSGWELVDEATFGSHLCLDSCPSATRTYATAGDAATATDEAVHALRAAGFEADASLHGSFRDGKIVVDVATEPRLDGTVDTTFSVEQD